MQKEYITQGTLNVIKRLKGSRNGNPRYLVEINGEEFRTQPDAMFGYAVTNYDGKGVLAKVCTYYGKQTITYAQETYLMGDEENDFNYKETPHIYLKMTGRN